MFDGYSNDEMLQKALELGESNPDTRILLIHEGFTPTSNILGAWTYNQAQRSYYNHNGSKIQVVKLSGSIARHMSGTHWHAIFVAGDVNYDTECRIRSRIRAPLSEKVFGYFDRYHKTTIESY